MKVVEKFISINGEGQKAGQLALFIRFAGCNLDCVYCDTKWANKSDVVYENQTKEELYDYIKNSGIKNVTITGGEPLLQEGITEFLELLAADDSLYIEIETNGSQSLKEFRDIKRISFTMDYKTEFSRMEKSMDLNNFNFLTQKDTLKFVVANINDLEKAKLLIDTYDLVEKTKVYFSPVFGEIDTKDIVEFMINKKLNGVNLQLQMHKIIWDKDTKGV